MAVHEGAGNPEDLGRGGIEFQAGDAHPPIVLRHFEVILQISHAAIEADPVPMLPPQQLVYRRPQCFPGNVPQGGFQAAGGMDRLATVEMGPAEIDVGPGHHLAKQPLHLGGVLSQKHPAVPQDMGSGRVIGPCVAVAADSLVGIDADQHPAAPPGPVHLQHGGLHVGNANFGPWGTPRGMGQVAILTGVHQQGAGRTRQR